MADHNHYTTDRHRRWREAVLRRDKYLCQECRKYGRNTAGNHAHHVKPVDDYPELAYTVSNGIALCGKCHNKIEPRILCNRHEEG